MTWGPWARRRADDFDALVERSPTGVTDDHAPARDADLLELVGALRAVPDPQVRPEFAADLRARLVAEAETALAPADLSKLRLPPRRTTRERRVAAVVGGLVIAGTTASVAVASQSALPGESLYPIKRVIESAQTELSLGEARKGDAELANASSRLDEAVALARSSDDGSALRVAPTLSAFTDQATSGADLLLADFAHTGREDAITRLHDFASSSMRQLEGLEPLVPDDARDELVAAADIVAQIDAEAEQQCPDCAGTLLGDIPPGLVAAQVPDLPVLPPVRQEPADPRPDRGRDHPQAGAGSQGGAGGQGSTSNEPRGTDDGPGLPVVGGDVPPASVSDPAPAGPTPSTKPNPIKNLTDGLANALTGGGSGSGSGSSSGSGSGPPPSGGTPSSPTDPVTSVVQGVGDILQGVLDPITGQLLPKK